MRKTRKSKGKQSKKMEMFRKNPENCKAEMQKCAYFYEISRKNSIFANDIKTIINLINSYNYE